MFELIKSIEVDRKNSLPVADLHARYRGTGTPVVFGDLTRRWRATSRWSMDYFSSNLGDVQVPIYSDNADVNGGRPSRPVLHSRLDVYLDDIWQNENDLRISELPLKLVGQLEKDFSYPRLGFDFNRNFTTISIAGKGATKPMVQSSSIIHTVQCNFGARASVLLIPPEMSGFMYRVGRSQNCVRDINFHKPQFDKYPALKKLSGYVAELGHGDALYIPAGFWYCVAYEGFGISLSFESLMGGFKDYAGAVSKVLLNRVVNTLPYSNARLTSLENRAVVETNERLLRHKKS